MTRFEIELRKGTADIKAARAKLTSESAAEAGEDMVRKYRKAKRDLEIRLDNLRDLNRDSALSLKVIKENFDKEKWLAEMHEVKCALRIANIEYEVALEIYEEWFKDSVGSEDDAIPGITPTSKKKKKKANPVTE